MKKLYDGSGTFDPASRGVWPATVSNLPCNCKHCIVDPDTDQCSYAPWRKTRPISIKVGCLPPEEAELLVNKIVARTVNKKIEFGMTYDYVPETLKWKVKYNDGTEGMLGYVEVFNEMKLFARTMPTHVQPQTES